MAVTQYIGARYVPLFAEPAEWTAARTYEPLTIVLHQGDSYTSRQFVPQGIDIADETYWAHTGSYNAQVEAYRQEVRTFDGRITANSDAIADFNSELGQFEEETRSAIAAETQAREAADMANANAIAENKTNIEQNTAAILENAGDIAAEAANRLAADEKIIASKVVTVEDYGAVGDGVTDCTAAIQQAINENPNTRITFRGGVYSITDTIFLNGDVKSTPLDLNGSTIVWNGRTSTWSEGNPVTLKPNHMGIMDNPIVMFAVERRAGTSSADGEPGRCGISNGTINANHRADIAIQNVNFCSLFENLRISNFQYAGIFNGTYDGKTYDMTGVVVSDNPMSTQTMISSCYFVRAEDMALRNTSCVFITYPDNQLDNLVTNRTRYGITMRCGGNSVSNTHITIEYPETPSLENFNGSAVRIWPFNAGASQFNVFENCYFNVGRYVFYAYKDSSQTFNGANLRTMVSNSHYTYYRSGVFGQSWVGAWFGGMWYGICIINQCGNIYGDYITFLPYYVPNVSPTLYFMRQNEWKFANTAPSHPHGRIIDSSNLCDDEWQFINNANNPLPAGKYKRIARINTYMPIGENADIIPGTIELEMALRNGGVYRKATITKATGSNEIVVKVDEDESIGSTSMKLYYSTTANKQFGNTVSHDIYAYNPREANVSDPRLVKISCSDPATHAYMLPDAVNYEDTDMENRNIYSSVSNIVEIF